MGWYPRGRWGEARVWKTAPGSEGPRGPSQNCHPHLAKLDRGTRRPSNHGQNQDTPLIRLLGRDRDGELSSEDLDWLFGRSLAQEANQHKQHQTAATKGGDFVLAVPATLTSRAAARRPISQQRPQEQPEPQQNQPNQKPLATRANQ